MAAPPVCRRNFSVKGISGGRTCIRSLGLMLLYSTLSPRMVVMVVMVSIPPLYFEVLLQAVRARQLRTNIPRLLYTSLFDIFSNHRACAQQYTAYCCTKSKKHKTEKRLRTPFFFSRERKRATGTSAVQRCGTCGRERVRLRM